MGKTEPANPKAGSGLPYARTTLRMHRAEVFVCSYGGAKSDLPLRISPGRSRIATTTRAKRHSDTHKRRSETKVRSSSLDTTTTTPSVRTREVAATVLRSFANTRRTAASRATDVRNTHEAVLP